MQRGNAYGRVCVCVSVCLVRALSLTLSVPHFLIVAKCVYQSVQRQYWSNTQFLAF